ncbi:Protein of unknown function [Bacillus cytotoxicus]|uniref:Uncharacterized protein n=1 Tax=Bacillus cytotoxicus TaxID=580165 RepID=A0AAX2CGB4_9BACI|nr:Protein of unknown function [Bacillus cytotoxicus]
MTDYRSICTIIIALEDVTDAWKFSGTTFLFSHL